MGGITVARLKSVWKNNKKKKQGHSRFTWHKMPWNEFHVVFFSVSNNFKPSKRFEAWLFLIFHRRKQTGDLATGKCVARSTGGMKRIRSSKTNRVSMVPIGWFNGFLLDFLTNWSIKSNRFQYMNQTTKPLDRLLVYLIYLEYQRLMFDCRENFENVYLVPTKHQFHMHVAVSQACRRAPAEWLKWGDGS